MSYILASYPRSGNTWVRYIIEWFSGRSTLGVNTVLNSVGNPIKGSPTDYPILGRLGESYINNKPIAIKRHLVDDLINGETNKNILLVIRNYKEVVLKHGVGSIDNKNIFERHMNFYMEMIRFYNEKFTKRKEIIYYEDLMTKNELTIKRILKFMKIYNEHKLRTFISNFKNHKNKSIKLYDKHMGGSTTMGNETIFYSKQLSKKQKVEWDSYVKSKWPILFNKYLKRYEEK